MISTTALAAGSALVGCKGEGKMVKHVILWKLKDDIADTAAVKAGIKAGDIIKQVSAIAGGSGGGKPDSAMGGGKDPLMLDNALAMVDNVVSMKLGW